MAERAAAYSGPPVPARRSATVVLLRPAPTAFQVYVMLRHVGMSFGGVWAFPGGSVDPSDAPSDAPCDLRPDWATRLGLPEPAAAAVVGAAVRELFEETGVLLADGGEPADEADRLALATRETTLAEVLARRGLRMRDDLLVPWARWVTPEFEPRRFDTWFFVAALPAGQDPEDVSGEASQTTWIRPDEAHRLPMLPPTVVMMHQLTGYPGIDAVLAADRDAARPVQPRLAVGPGGETVLRLG
jgi:8-oxo-dGTP pyrophosphatase MutT (NUDIX family)